MAKNEAKIIISASGSEQVRAEISAINNNFEKLKASCGNLTNSFIKAQLAVAGIMTAFRSLMDTTKKLVEIPAAFEGFTTQLETVLGSAEKAESAFAWIKEFTSKTPYELAEVTEAFVQLESVGLNAIDAIKPIGDAAASMNKRLLDTVTAVISMEREVLKRYGIDLREEGDRAVFIWRNKQGEMVKTVAEGGQEIRRQTLLAIWNDRYQGGMDRFQTTWRGMWSNFKDSIILFVNAIGKAGIFDFLKEQLKALNAWISQMGKEGRLQQWALQISDAMRFTGQAIIFVIRSISSLIGFLKEHADIIKGVLAGALAFLVSKYALTSIAITNFAWGIKNLTFLIQYLAIVIKQRLAVSLAALSLSGPVGLAIAGISALAGVFVYLHSKAKDAEKAHRDFLGTLKYSSKEKIEQELFVLKEEKLKKAEERVKKLERYPGSTGLIIGLKQAENELNLINTQIATAEARLTEIQREEAKLRAEELILPKTPKTIDEKKSAIQDFRDYYLSTLAKLKVEESKIWKDAAGEIIAEHEAFLEEIAKKERDAKEKGVNISKETSEIKAYAERIKQLKLNALYEEQEKKAKEIEGAISEIYLSETEKRITTVEKQFDEYQEQLDELSLSDERYNELSEKLWRARGHAIAEINQKIADEQQEAIDRLLVQSKEMVGAFTEEEQAIRSYEDQIKELDKLELEDEEFNRLSTILWENRTKAIENATEKIRLQRQETSASLSLEYQKLVGNRQQQIEAEIKHLEAQRDKEVAIAKQKGEDTFLIEQLYNEKIRLKREEATGSFVDGWFRALDEFARHAQTAFERGVELARQTAQAMQQAFSNFFFDALTGRLKTLKDYWNAFWNSMVRIQAEHLAKMVTDWIWSQNTMQTTTGGDGGIGGILSSVGRLIGSFFGIGGGSSITLTAPEPSASSYNLGNYAARLQFDPAYLQEGGIVTRPTFAVIGEKGPEAVIPLSKISGESANNYTFNIYAVDAPSFIELCRRNPEGIINAVDSNIRRRGTLRQSIREAI